MSSLTAKTVRQQILQPDAGVFLFHARAIERLISSQLAIQLQGVTIPRLPYYLMPRDDFLFGLETENAEALSVIEGLRLPEYVILLPSPNTQRLDDSDFDRLRYDYWGRRFEAEIARTWQIARDHRHDHSQFGVAALQRLIGSHAYIELRAVLAHDGITLPIWNDSHICRAFISLIIRLRYFAPGARAFFFPAIRTWPQVDAWLTASGLDLPPPLTTPELPDLLVKTCPGGGHHQLGAYLPLLPITLPYGQSDPDFHPALLRMGNYDRLETEPAPAVETINSASFDTAALARRCHAAHQQGVLLRKRRLMISCIFSAIGGRLSRIVGRLLFSPTLERWRWWSEPVVPTGIWLDAGLLLFRHAVAAAQRAELRNQSATALIHLANARRLLRRLQRFCQPVNDRLCQALGSAENASCDALAYLLAAKLKLDTHTSTELHTLVQRLVATDRGQTAVQPARTLLLQLEQVLLETRHDDYRLRPWHWLVNGGRVRMRQILPFQSPLRALRALAVARARLEELPWPMPELERFSVTLDSLTQRLTSRLEAQLTPRLERAMRDAGFIPRNHRERIAAHKMVRELLDVIRLRRHLKFTDVRDIVARNILRLPDPSVDEFFHGDRLRRFDRMAARVLPGVYRPGEIYILGLQQLSAPLFGTNAGRNLLRHVLIPFGGAYLGLKSLDLFQHLLPISDSGFRFAQAMTVIGIGSTVNLLLHTKIGWHISCALWRGVSATSHAISYMLFGEGLRQLLRWPPLAQLLNTQLMRGIGRHFIAPLLIGILPLIPIMGLAVIVEEVPIRPGVWLLSLAFALGTLVRNTPTGRRFLDNFITSTVWLFRRINQTLILGAIRQLLSFFKELTRRFAQILHRVDESLTHHLAEHWMSFIAKMILTPVWHLLEGLMQFYITVLIEPQVNPVKHFPIVTVGHKLLLPLLPAITSIFITVTESILPKLIAYPLVTLTIVLLPGLFGFLAWELKENWRLYEANHTRRSRRYDSSQSHDDRIEPAIVGEHGETIRGILCRGFHSGILPKGFDRLRRVIRDELRDHTSYSKRIRTSGRRLAAIERAICVFVDRELAFALRERCRDPQCILSRVETGTPRLATNLIDIQIALYIRAHGHEPAPVWIQISLSLTATGIDMEVRTCGPAPLIGPPCWAMVAEDLRLFAERAQAQIIPIGLPSNVLAALTAKHTS